MEIFKFLEQLANTPHYQYNMEEWIHTLLLNMQEAFQLKNSAKLKKCLDNSDCLADRNSVFKFKINY